MDTGKPNAVLCNTYNTHSHIFSFQLVSKTEDYHYSSVVLSDHAAESLIDKKYKPMRDLPKNGTFNRSGLWTLHIDFLDKQIDTYLGLGHLLL